MLETSLSATVDDAVEFELTVANEGEEPVEVTFRDAGKAEFVVLDDGAEVWRWSEGRMFAQVVETVEVAPGESTTFEASWPDPAPGSYRAVGELRAQADVPPAEATFLVE